MSDTGHCGYRVECCPERVSEALRALSGELVGLAPLPPCEGGSVSWVVLAQRCRWWVGWHGRAREQWDRLAEWALVTGQPDAVLSAIFTAECTESTQALANEARAAEYERRAGKPTGATACDTGQGVG
jgi:hypothetical protein